jgi:hypothetical protein
MGGEVWVESVCVVPRFRTIHLKRAALPRAFMVKLRRSNGR